MDYAEKMDMMDDDCDIEGFPVVEKTLKFYDLFNAQYRFKYPPMVTIAQCFTLNKLIECHKK